MRQARIGLWLTLVMLILGGCYRHVVRAEGIGTDGMSVHEANLKEPKATKSSRPSQVPSKDADDEFSEKLIEMLSGEDKGG